MNGGEAEAESAVVVICVGDELRGDDAIGPRVATQLRGEPGVSVCCCEGIEMLDAWASAGAAVIVDAMRSGAPPGTIIRLDATCEPVARATRRGAVHTVGVADAIELARALGCLPQTLIVFAVEGERFEIGTAPSDAVQAALDPLLTAIRHEIRCLRRFASPAGAG